jgi:hypothetical protein
MALVTAQLYDKLFDKDEDDDAPCQLAGHASSSADSLCRR